jgi:hypothetical protein
VFKFSPQLRNILRSDRYYNALCRSSTRKTPQYMHFHENSFYGSRVATLGHGRTDKHDEANTCIPATFHCASAKNGFMYGLKSSQKIFPPAKRKLRSTAIYFNLNHKLQLMKYKTIILTLSVPVTCSHRLFILHSQFIQQPPRGPLLQLHGPKSFLKS